MTKLMTVVRLKRAQAFFEVLNELADGGTGESIDIEHFRAELLKRHRALFRRIAGLTLD